MGSVIDFDKFYKVSDDVVARKIEDEIIIVPLVSGIGDMEDELFTLNKTGEVIWDRLDGTKSLREIVTALAAEYEDSEKNITDDVLGFVKELEARRIIIEVNP